MAAVKFKIGDKVRVIPTKFEREVETGAEKGAEGIVTATDDMYDYDVTFTDGMVDLFDEHELEAV
jgi:hypothetical protein